MHHTGNMGNALGSLHSWLRKIRYSAGVDEERCVRPSHTHSHFVQLAKWREPPPRFTHFRTDNNRPLSLLVSLRVVVCCDQPWLMNSVARISRIFEFVTSCISAHVNTLAYPHEKCVLLNLESS